MNRVFLVMSELALLFEALSRFGYRGFQECHSGYYRDASFHCAPYGCEVDTGCSVCVHQSLRTAEGQCAECRPGYRKTLDDLCEPYSCLIGGAKSKLWSGLEGWSHKQEQCREDKSHCSDGASRVYPMFLFETFE